jgi:hypothetical protein
VSLFHTPGLQIIWIWHMSATSGGPKQDIAVNPDGFLRLSFGARFDSPGVESEYLATMTLISRDSGKQYHYPVPWSWTTNLGKQIMWQLFWSRAADATQDERGLFLFQPTLVSLDQGERSEWPDQSIAFWDGRSSFAIAEEPHYLLMEGPLWGRLPYSHAH